MGQRISPENGTIFATPHQCSAKRYKKWIMSWQSTAEQRKMLSYGIFPTNSEKILGMLPVTVCQAAFREWLKKRYKTLDELNHAWM